MHTILVPDVVLERLHGRSTTSHWMASMRESTFFYSYVQLNLWCSEHCSGGWFREKDSSTYAFENASDAMMFKMAFGG